MFNKLFKVILLIVLALSFSTITIFGAEASTNKVMWGKTELKLGQIGKVTILSKTELVKLESDGSLSTVRTIKKVKSSEYITSRVNMEGYMVLVVEAM